jgi:aminoglycoside phosphotransferase (APT) family kinase protein
MAVGIERMTTEPQQRMPTERMLDWAVAAMGGGARITKIRTLHGDDPPWLLSIEHDGGTTEAVLRGGPPNPRVGPRMIATGAAALGVAERHALRAPRLIAADVQGDVTGAVTTLETLVPGSTTWPSPPSAKRLRAAGAALARVHSVPMAPAEHLPFRPRPIAVDDFAGARRKGRMPTTPLLEEADRLVTAHGLPTGGTVFVHGDVWPGNIIWTDDDVPVLIDWKTAGVGAPSVDLGGLRNQLNIMFGAEAPDLVLDGWQQATGTEARDVAYWDAVAALNTRTELDNEYGIAGATDRRDAFLAAAVANLGT